jgi:hypothetical protein
VDPQWDTSHKWYDQGFTETFSINSSLKWSLQKDWKIADGRFENQYTDMNSIQQGWFQPDSITSNALKDFLPFTTTTTAILSGSTLIGTKTRELYADGTSYLDKEMYLIDELGGVQDLLALYSQPNFAARILDYNWELIWSAPEFSGRTIDLVVIPQIFNEMTF